MSSHYTVVSCAEWERMQEEIRSADAYVIANELERKRLEKLAQERRMELQRMREANGRAIDHAVSLLAITGRNMTKDLTEQVRERLDRHHESVSGQMESLREDVARTGYRMAQSVEAVERIADEYARTIDALTGRWDDAKDRASAYLQEFDAMLERIRELHPEAFVASDFEALESKRRSLAINMQDHDYQAALALAQGSIVQSGRTLARAILMSEQYAVTYGEVKEQLIRLQERVGTLLSPDGKIIVSLGEEEIETSYDPSYWSDGIFDEIAERIAVIGEQIDMAGKRPVGLDALEGYGRQLIQMEQQVTLCDEEARKELAGAISVENMAGRLYDNLRERGWQLMDGAGRRDGDDRKPYSMSYQDGGGNTISMVISAGKDPERPDLSYEAFSDSEGMRSLIKEGIDGAFAALGLGTGNMLQRNDCHENGRPEQFIRNMEHEAESILGSRQQEIRNSLGSVKKTGR